MSNKYCAIERLAKLLMPAGVTKLSMHLINMLKWDLGPPHDIVVEDVVTGKVEIGFGVCLLERGARFLSIYTIINRACPVSKRLAPRQTRLAPTEVPQRDAQTNP
ncbi:unnamed protein product [Prunus armeniaca]